MLETLWQDLRFGARMLRKNPGFSLIAILTLALGIGANTAIFSVVNAVLLRPLQFKDPEQLVWIWGTVPKFGQANHSPVEFLAFQTQQQSFTELAAYRSMSFTVTGGTQPEQAQGTMEAGAAVVARVAGKNDGAAVESRFFGKTTRRFLLMQAIADNNNHYGQLVFYLRLNGLTPPGSR